MADATEVTDRPENSAQLADLIESLTVFDYADGGEGYEKSADAMWKAALAAFEYVASRVGATGFMGSWAAMKFYGEAMSIKGPWMVVRIEDALYPQYDLPGRVQGAIDESAKWLAEKAATKLIESADSASPRVVEHWRNLVAAAESTTPTEPTEANPRG